MAQQEIVLTNSGHESFETLINQRMTSRWLSGEFPYISRRNVSGVRKSVPLLLPGGDVILRVQNNKSICILQEARDHSWILASALSRSYAQVAFVVASKEASLADNLLRSLTKGIKRKTVSDPHRVRVKFWYMDARDGPQSVLRNIDIRTWDEIRDNYVKTVQEPVGDLMSVTSKQIAGRIILMHGPAGTGKTTLIRALGGAWRSWCDVHYVMDPEVMLSNGTYMMQALLDGDTARWRLVIMEDSGELFKDTAKKETGQALSRLLNMTDGILGQGRKIIFALTTNEPVRGIHAAVMRPGRAMANLEIPAFSREEAENWLGKPVSDKMSCTLANLLTLKYPEQIGVITSGEAKVYETGQYL